LQGERLVPCSNASCTKNKFSGVKAPRGGLLSYLCDVLRLVQESKDRSSKKIWGLVRFWMFWYKRAEYGIPCLSDLSAEQGATVMVRIFPVLLIIFSFFSTSIARAQGYTATAITFEPMEFDTSKGKWVSMDKIQKSGSIVELNLNHGSIYGLKIIIQGKQGKPRWSAQLHATIECSACFYQGKDSKHKIKILPAATIPVIFGSKKTKK
jgi:hypothetical protein